MSAQVLPFPALKQGDRFTVEEGVTAKCRCGLVVTIGHLAGPGQTPVAVHELPTCQEYESLDLLTYLRWLNQRDVC